MTVHEVEILIEEAEKALSAGKDENPRKHGKLKRSEITEIAKSLPVDGVLADELYGKPSEELQLIAAMIDDPESYTLDEIELRSEQLHPTEIGTVFCRRVMAKSPHAVHFISKWMDSKDSARRCFAYLTLEELAKKDCSLSQGFYRAHLRRIASEIKTETPSVQEAMSKAAAAIVKKVPDLESTNKKELDAVRRFAT